MTRWEYRRVEASVTGRSAAPLQDEALNRLGAEGWELVGLVATGMSSLQAVFKRPAP